MRSSRQRRLLTALSILLFLLLLWVLTAVQLDPTAAQDSRISISLRPQFSPGEGGRSLASITLTIIGNFVEDLRLSLYDPGEEGQASQLTPEPTATGPNSKDEPSQTPTEDADAPADTPVPTDTPQSVVTPDSFKPTSTPETSTPTPTEGADVSAVTSTPDPTPTDQPDDEHDPELSEGTLDVADGSTISCQQTVHVTDLRVFDPEYSAGIKWVKLKYKIQGSSVGYVYSDPLTKTSGGWANDTKTEWNALYKGSIEIEFEDGWALNGGPKALARVMLSSDETATPTPTGTISTTASPTPTPTPDLTPSATPTSTATKAPSPTPTPTPTSDSYTVELWALAEDNDGNPGYLQLATYTMVCP